MVGTQAEMQCFSNFRFFCAEVQEGPLLNNFIYPRAVVSIGDPGSLILGRDRQVNKNKYSAQKTRNTCGKDGYLKMHRENCRNGLR